MTKSLAHFKYNIDFLILLLKEEMMNCINQNKEKSRRDVKGYSTALDFA